MSRSSYFYSGNAEVHSSGVSIGSNGNNERNGKKGNIRFIADHDFSTGHRTKQNL